MADTITGFLAQLTFFSSLSGIPRIIIAGYISATWFKNLVWFLPIAEIFS
jgi:hypothetical protein